MASKRPYTHILKNLFHEQAQEIVPLLIPNFRVEGSFEVELPEFESAPRATPPGPMEEGLVNIILPEATVVGSYAARLIEESGHFERVYRVQDSGKNGLRYLAVQFQTDHEPRKLPFDLLQTMLEVEMSREDASDEPVIYHNDDDEEFNLTNEIQRAAHRGDSPENEKSFAEYEKRKAAKPRGTHTTVYIDPVIICPFPSAIPAPIHSELHGVVLMEFSFDRIDLWEKDAREFLNSRVSASYFLLPCMKNVDAALLKLAIEELAHRFQDNDLELGRHLTGMNLFLEGSETMTEEEKQAAQVHLQRFAPLMKHDSMDE